VLTCQSLRGHSRRYGLGSSDFADRSSMSERPHSPRVRYALDRLQAFAHRDLDRFIAQRIAEKEEDDPPETDD
jgi:hypothetical protein